MWLVRRQAQEAQEARRLIEGRVLRSARPALFWPLVLCSVLGCALAALLWVYGPGL